MTDVRIRDIEKSFFGTRVLKQVSFDITSGRTIGLVGENGAGKSTLMNILGGNLVPDGGDVLLDDRPYSPQSPRDAQAAGVAFIHQELNLFSNLSIAENLFLNRFPTVSGCIRRGEVRRRAADLLARVGLDLSPSVLVESLSAGERQLVEIARALDLNARLLILDEPTTSLTAREKNRLFDLLRVLQGDGLAMIYISHALEDVRALCDDVVILRDGQVVGVGDVAEFETARMISLMVGRDVSQLFPTRSGMPSDERLLSVCNVSQPGVVKDITFQLNRGEVLGIAGLMGSGRTELARILFGLDSMAEGTIALGDERIDGLSPRKRIRRGMAMLTESRRDDGLCMQSSIGSNFSLVFAPTLASRWIGRLPMTHIGDRIGAMRDSVGLTASAKLSQPAQTLSGGNQQKVVLGKWLLNSPRVLILDEPTRGVDVGAKYEIYGLIDQLAADGEGVIMISSELEELVGICDRILVLRRGEIADVFERERFDLTRIMESCFSVPFPNEAADFVSVAAQRGRRLLLFVLNQASLLLFALVFLVLGCLSDRFLEPQNLTNILVQSSSTGLVAIGMTLVLLTAGVDLSVGSVMFIAVAVTGTLITHEIGLAAAFVGAIVAGAVCGAVNGFLITRWKVIAFIATLGTLFVGRGFGLWLTNTRAMNMPDGVTSLGTVSWFGLPLPVVVLFAVAALVSGFLRFSPWGRQLYAIGQDVSAARKAGLRVDTILFFVYVACGVLAAVGGLVALTQTGAVSPSFGQQKEFAAIAAAVLGGTSLFGGRGSVIPGVLFGAILFQTVENGLVIVNADPYLYPLVISGIIFLAVLVDASRRRWIKTLSRRRMRLR